MKVLVTGANGMLGRNLVKTLKNSTQHEVIPWSRVNVDLMDFANTKALMNRVKPDLVIHAAALVGGIRANLERPLEFLVNNLVIDSNLIRAALESGVKNYIYFGSSCMFPKNAVQPLREQDLFSGPLEDSNEGYAIAKLSGARSMSYASAEYGVNYKAIILSNLYGPGDNYKPDSSHLVAAAISKVHEAKVRGKSSISVWGDGGARREFTYVEDVANWISINLERSVSWPQIMNLGFGQDYSVNEIYRAVAHSLHVKIELINDTSKPSGMRQKLLDSTLANRDFGWKPSTTLSTGLQLAYEDFLQRSEK